MKVKQTKIVSVCLLAVCLIASLLCANYAVSTRGYAMQTADDAAVAASTRLTFPQAGEDGLRFGEENFTGNFVYSAKFTPIGDAQPAGLIFGANETHDEYWMATADIAESKVQISQVKGDSADELRSAAYTFEQGKPFKLTLVLNQGVAKVFVGDDTVAALTLKLQEYSGGALGLKAPAEAFQTANVSLMQNDSYEGHLYVGGYRVEKVINITDGHTKLASGDYTLKSGVLTLTDGYLKTLEAGETYTFRAVTDFTDFDFDVTPDFASVTVRPAADRFYSGNDVVVEFTAGAEVRKVTVDGNEVAFEVKDGNVVISAENAAAAGFGKHTVRLYTDRGRSSAEFVLAEPVETLTEMPVKATHIFFWVDMIKSSS